MIENLQKEKNFFKKAEPEGKTAYAGLKQGEADAFVKKRPEAKAVAAQSQSGRTVPSIKTKKNLKKKLLLEAFFFNIINFYDIFSKNWRTFSKKIKHKGI